MCRIEQGQQGFDRALVHGPHQRLGLDRAHTGRESTVSQRRVNMDRAVAAVAGSGACRRREHPQCFEVAHLLDRAAGLAGDVDRAKSAVVTSQETHAPADPQSLHENMSVTVEGMNIDDITEHLVGLGGVLTLQPQPGDGSPQISWGDTFFYYAPDGVIPTGQPFATIVTKDYPDDNRSRLDRPDAFRLNIAASTATFHHLLGRDPREPAPDDTDDTGDLSVADVLIPHPVYGHLGWLAVVNPDRRTSSTVNELLDAAHHAAQVRYTRRNETTAS